MGGGVKKRRGEEESGGREESGQRGGEGMKVEWSGKGIEWEREKEGTKEERGETMKGKEEGAEGKRRRKIGEEEKSGIVLYCLYLYPGFYSYTEGATCKTLAFAIEVLKIPAGFPACELGWVDWGSQSRRTGSSSRYHSHERIVIEPINTDLDSGK